MCVEHRQELGSVGENILALGAGSTKILGTSLVSQCLRVPSRSETVWSQEGAREHTGRLGWRSGLSPGKIQSRAEISVRKPQRQHCTVERAEVLESDRPGRASGFISM